MYISYTSRVRGNLHITNFYRFFFSVSAFFFLSLLFLAFGHADICIIKYIIVRLHNHLHDTLKMTSIFLPVSFRAGYTFSYIFLFLFSISFCLLLSFLCVRINLFFSQSLTLFFLFPFSFFSLFNLFSFLLVCFLYYTFLCKIYCRVV